MCQTSYDDSDDLSMSTCGFIALLPFVKIRKTALISLQFGSIFQTVIIAPYDFQLKFKSYLPTRSEIRGSSLIYTEIYPYIKLMICPYDFIL